MKGGRKEKIKKGKQESEGRGERERKSGKEEDIK